MTAKDKSYYSTREAADLLGVAVSTVQLWTNNGILSAWTTGGGHRRITCGSVDKLLEEQTALHSSDEDKRLSIVIVEDDLKQLTLYLKQIKIIGLDADITTATNGFEGLIKIGSVIPDIIITDILMPNIDGLQMIHELKKIPALKYSSIIVATGLTKDEIKERGPLPAGIEVLTKPVFIEDLRDKLVNLQQLTDAAKRVLKSE